MLQRFLGNALDFQAISKLLGNYSKNMSQDIAELAERHAAAFQKLVAQMSFFWMVHVVTLSALRPARPQKFCHGTQSRLLEESR